MSTLSDAHEAVRITDEALIEARMMLDEMREYERECTRDLAKAKSHLEFVRLNMYNPMPVPQKKEFTPNVIFKTV